MQFFNNIKLLLAALISSVIIFIAIYWPPAQLVFKTVSLDKMQLIKVGGYLTFAPILSAIMQKILNGKKSTKRRLHLGIIRLKSLFF